MKTMKIIGYRYKIKVDGDVDSIGAFGRQHPAKQEIQIASNLTKSQTASTLLHEVIEAANYHLQLGLQHQVIMSLESVLYQALTENGISLRPWERIKEGK